MTTRAWTLSVRTLLVTLTALAAVWATAPRASAMGPADLAADAFVADISQAFEQFQSDHEALLMEIVNEIQAAGDSGDLKQVLKLEKRYNKRIDKTLKPYRKLTTKRGKSVVKNLNKKKFKSDPTKDFAVDWVQQEVTRRLTEIDMVESDLRFHVSSSVEAAVNAIMQ